MLDAILLYIGGSLLYWGRIWYLHPLTHGLILVAPQMMVYGALAIVAGIIVAWKIRSFLWLPKKAPHESPPLKDNGGDISVGITS